MFSSSTSPLTIHHRPRNRNTYIAITQEGEVCVRTPLKDEKRIRSILREKEGWINAKLLTIRSRPSQAHTLGENIRFRGEVMALEHFERLHQKVTKETNPLHIEKQYHQFYKNEAILTLPSRIDHYAQKMKLKPKEIRYKRMKRRWGSCSSAGVVTFNTLMLQLSYAHIDYIIVHELAHLKEMNHSPEFHALVRTILADEKRLRCELKAIRIS
jgi:hypothetical protein